MCRLDTAVDVASIDAITASGSAPINQHILMEANSPTIGMVISVIEFIDQLLGTDRYSLSAPAGALAGA